MNQQHQNEGYLYILYNDTYKTYGTNVYKLGLAKNIDNRKSQYGTYYLNPSEILHKSEKFRNKYLAETILFVLLKNID
jgi:hypothetical protein